MDQVNQGGGGRFQLGDQVIQLARGRVVALAAKVLDFRVNGFLAGKMLVEERFRDAGGAGQVLGGGFRVALAAKKGQGGPDDGRLALLRG